MNYPAPMMDCSSVCFLFMVALVVFVIVIAVKKGRRAGGGMMGLRTCRACGQGHPGYAEFCRRCGQKL